MKIYGNLSGHWKLSVIEVSVLERFDCTAIQFLFIFFEFYFPLIILGIGQTQSIYNIFKEFFLFFSSHGNLCTTMSESSLVELMQSVGVVHECLNAFFLHIQWIERGTGRHKFRVTTRGRTKYFVGEWLSKVDCISSHTNVAFC